MTPSQPTPMERSPRSVEKPASGALLYSAAAVFFLGTAAVAGLWVKKAVNAHRLEQRLAESQGKEDYEAAVAAVRELQTAAPRLSRNRWRSQEANLLLKWAQRQLSRDDFKGAIDHAIKADDVGHRTGLGKDFLKQVEAVSAAAALGQLKNDWSSLAFDERVSRCQAIHQRYPECNEAAEAESLRKRAEQDKETAENTFKVEARKAGQLEADGRIAEALKEWETLRPGISEKDVARLQECDAGIRKLKDRLADRYYVLEPRLQLEGGRAMGQSRASVLSPGQDLLPLFHGEPGKAATRGASQTTLPAAHPDVAFSFEQGVLYCMSAETGELRWALEQGLGMRFEPVRVGEDAICVSNSGKHISRLNSWTGKVVWTLQLSDPLSCSPVPAGSDIAALDQGGCLSILDAGTGRPVAQRRFGDAGWLALVSDSHSRLAAVAPDRAILFEKGQTAWFEIAGIILSADHDERVSLFGRYICLLPHAAAPSTVERRLLRWRDMSLTAMGTPSIANGWRLVDQQDDLQLWIDPQDVPHCVRVNDASADSILEPLGSMSVPAVKDGCLAASGGNQAVILTGEGVRCLDVRRGSGAPFVQRWETAVCRPRTVTALRTLLNREGSILVRGEDSAAGGIPVFAGLSLSNGAVLWTSRLGPNISEPPAASADRIVWPDGETGLWTIGPDEGLGHKDGGLSQDKPAAPVQVVGDGLEFLVYGGDELMLYDKDLKALWDQPAKAPGAISRACLQRDFIAALTGTGDLWACSRKAGKPLGAALAVGPKAFPCAALLPYGETKVVLAGQGGSSLAAAIESPGTDGKWQVSPLWKDLPGLKHLVRVHTGFLAFADGGWCTPGDGQGALAPGLERFLYSDEAVALVGSQGTGELACIDLKLKRERWRAKIDAAPLWADRVDDKRFLSLTGSGHLLVLDSAKGDVRAREVISGVPTATPGRSKGHLWIPVSGYRLVKLPLSRLGQAGAK